MQNDKGTMTQQDKTGNQYQKIFKPSQDKELGDFYKPYTRGNTISNILGKSLRSFYLLVSN